MADETPRRSIRIADSDWNRIKAKAKASRMSVPQFIVAMLADPDREVAQPRRDQTEILERLEVMVRVVFEAECARLVQAIGSEASEELKRGAEEHVRRERDLG